MLTTPMGGALQHVVPTDQPYASLPELEESTGEPTWATTPLTPPMEVVEAAKVVEVEKVAEARETEKDTALVTPVWTQIHPTRAAVPVDLSPIV